MLDSHLPSPRPQQSNPVMTTGKVTLPFISAVSTVDRPVCYAKLGLVSTLVRLKVDVIDCAKIVLKIIRTGIISITDRTIVKQSRP
jgi:hypothetical protein